MMPTVSVVRSRGALEIPDTVAGDVRRLKSQHVLLQKVTHRSLLTSAATYAKHGFTWVLLLVVAPAIFSPATSLARVTNYFAQGIIHEVKPEERQVVIAHEEIPGFMNAMTMPFDVKETNLFATLSPGQKVVFQLHVTEIDSWIDNIKAIGSTANSTNSAGGAPSASKTSLPTHSKNPLRNYKFTNELGQAVSLSDFKGQALALTFFFTRCPIPQYCPRLSKNFEETQLKLAAMENAPTNWHLLSVTFDPTNDAPQVLKAYGERYSYDPVHWSFLTGPPEKIAEFARLCDVQFDPENGLLNHNFRTLIIDASNRLQRVFPISGDLSDSIVKEILQAAKPSAAHSIGNSEAGK
jgi:protein SCO1/2